MQARWNVKRIIRGAWGELDIAVRVDLALANHGFPARISGVESVLVQVSVGRCVSTIHALYFVQCAVELQQMLIRRACLGVQMIDVLRNDVLQVAMIDQLFQYIVCCIGLRF